MDCLLARHNQTWRIKEYHLLGPISSIHSDSDTNSHLPSPSQAAPVPVGEALYAHLPDDADFIELDKDRELHVRLPPVYGPGPRKLVYTRCQRPDEEAKAEYNVRVQDILLVGEGHSGWGEFRLLGRVRPADGFVSIIKEYVGPLLLSSTGYD